MFLVLRAGLPHFPLLAQACDLARLVCTVLNKVVSKSSCLFLTLPGVQPNAAHTSDPQSTAQLVLKAAARKGPWLVRPFRCRANMKACCIRGTAWWLPVGPLQLLRRCLGAAQARLLPRLGVPRQRSGSRPSHVNPTQATLPVDFPNPKC